MGRDPPTFGAVDSSAAVVPYTLTFLLLLLAPGPDFALVVRNAARGGRSAGIATAAGVASGLAVHAVVVALGLGAVIAASAVAFVVIKLVGAVYLVGLGLTSLLAAVRRRAGDPDRGAGGPLPEVATEEPPGLGRAYRQGVLGNVLNPKAVLIYLALMPQFLPAHPSVASTVELSAVNVITAAVWYVVVGLAVAAVGRVLRRERVRRALDAVTGSVLIAFGARLAAAH